MGKQRSSNASIFLVYVDKTRTNDLSGRLYNGYFQTPFVFESAGDFLVKVDAILDSLEYPQRYVEERKLRPCATVSRVRRKPEPRWDRDVLQSKGNCFAAFHIQILFRQNASWQGRFMWPRRTAVLFRSALELLYLVFEAIEQMKSGSAALESGESGI